jgi:hypothetical protein
MIFRLALFRVDMPRIFVGILQKTTPLVATF